ncbi:MAG: AEC family transporter [Chloroflexi bacterium]|nr:AEC family transporter [Chloroflexota bacterium]
MILTIIVNIILPIFVLVGVGIVMDRTFHLDLATLSKLNFYVFVPALIFIKTLDAQLSPALFASVAAFTALHIVLMFVLSWTLFGLPPFSRQRPVLTLAAILSNAGNYGIPLATLAFGAQGASAMAIVVMVQNLATFTAGLWIMDSGRSHWSDVVKGFLKVPVVWAVVAALVLIVLKVELPRPIRDPMTYLSDGLIPVALVTLGVQLARSRFGAQLKTVSLVTAIRLLLSPLLAVVMAAVWSQLSPATINPVAPVMVIAAGMPVAVNVYILSVEYARDSELASRAIFATTLLSALTLTFWLLIVKGA